jgi:hypothetical protein
VGAALGVIALVALGWFIGRRAHKKKQESNPYGPGAAQPLPPKYVMHEMQATPTAELAGNQVHAHELSAHPHELPTQREK